MKVRETKPGGTRGGTEREGFATARSVLGMMQTPVSTLQASDSVAKAIGLLGSDKGRQSPVLRGDELVGVLCKCDLSQLISSPLGEIAREGRIGGFDRVRVEEMVAGGAVSIGPYHSILTAAQVLLERRICALPVVEERKVVGLVTQIDLLRALVDIVKELEARL